MDAGNRTLQLSATDTLPFLQSIARIDSLDRLSLINMRLSGTGTVALLRALTPLQVLTLNKCQMGPNDAVQIAEALKTNENIQIVFLIPTFTDADMLPLVQRLAFNRHLYCLLLSMDEANEDNAEIVTTYLQAFTRCQTKYESDICDIRDEASFRSLIRAIPHIKMRRLRFKFQLDLTVEDRMPRFCSSSDSQLQYPPGGGHDGE